MSGSGDVKIDQLQIIGEAIIILALPSALPIPTGGIAHSLSIVIILFSFWGLVLGGVKPKTQEKFEVGRNKVLRFKRLREFHDSLWQRAGQLLKNRKGWIFDNRLFLALTSLLIIICAACFWTVIPLADTPPSIAVILFGFSLVYKDIYAWFAAVIVGVFGLVINLGSLLFVITKITEFITSHI